MFDTLVLILTLSKLGNLSATKSKVGKQIYRDNICYFLLTTATNLTVFSIQTLGSESTLIKPTVIPFSTLMTATMGSRVFLNLKLFDKRQKAAADEGIPLVKGSHAYGFHHRTFSQSHSHRLSYVLDITAEPRAGEAFETQVNYHSDEMNGIHARRNTIL